MANKKVLSDSEFLNYVSLIILILVFFFFSYNYMEFKAEKPHILIGCIVIQLLCFAVLLISAILHFNSKKSEKKSNKDEFFFLELILSTIIIFASLLLYMDATILANDIYSSDKKLELLFTFGLLLVNVILIGLTAISLYYTNQRSSREIREKNINSEIEFYEKQLDKYYIPLSEKLFEISGNIVDYFSYYENLNEIDFPSYNNDENQSFRFFSSKFFEIRKSLDEAENITIKYAYLNTDEINFFIFNDSQILEDLSYFNYFSVKFSSIAVDDVNNFVNSNTKFKRNSNDSLKEDVVENFSSKNFNQLVHQYLGLVQTWINVEMMVVKRMVKGETTSLDIEFVNERNHILFELVIKHQQLSSDKILIAAKKINERIGEKYLELKDLKQ
jgi:hypothetical protein